MNVERDPVFGCELAQGRADRDGYVFHGQTRAHIHAWIAANGSVPDGLVIDHLCRRRNCVALHHLEAVTQSENEKRKSWRYRRRRVKCRAGHELEEHGVVTPEGGVVCRQCNREAGGVMVRNYDRETTTCSGALPKIRQRSEIEDCGQDGVCKLSPGCNRHWEERNRELVHENAVLRSNSDHLSSENASLSRQVESMAMRIESLAEELAKPEDVRLREVIDALDGRAVIFDGLGARVGHLLDEMDEWIERAGVAERRLK